MARFDNAKIGDKVYCLMYGWGKIHNIDKKYIYCIDVYFNDCDISFTIDGKRFKEDINHVLFWNEVKLPTEEEDKRPFNLAEFLINNLEPKEFENGKPNYYLRFTKSFDNSWSFEINCHTDMIGVCFKEGKRSIEIELTRNKITPKQLRDAYKELGWL